jgi:hypothetical protein
MRYRIHEQARTATLVEQVVDPTVPNVRPRRRLR